MSRNEDRLGINNISNFVQDDADLFLKEANKLENDSLELDFINSNTEFVDLPSKGKFYFEGHPLKNKDSIEIKFMTAKDEDMLSNKSYIKKTCLCSKER
jgi:hypothetical protein